jgi:hypothetical protein
LTPDPDAGNRAIVEHSTAEPGPSGIMAAWQRAKNSAMIVAIGRCEAVAVGGSNAGIVA